MTKTIRIVLAGSKNQTNKLDTYPVSVEILRLPLFSKIQLTLDVQNMHHGAVLC
jgi:hypothetical protein